MSSGVGERLVMTCGRHGGVLRDESPRLLRQRRQIDPALTGSGNQRLGHVTGRRPLVRIGVKARPDHLHEVSGQPGEIGCTGPDVGDHGRRALAPGAAPQSKAGEDGAQGEHIAGRCESALLAQLLGEAYA